MVAESDETRQITSRQRLAVTALASGATDAEAAKAAKVSRQTVNAWRNHSPLFIQALRAEQNKIRAGRTKKLLDIHRELKEAALETLLKGIRTGDLVSARWLLEKFHLSEDTKILNEQEQKPEEESLEEILLEMAKARVKKSLDRESIDRFEREALEPHMVKRVYDRLHNEYITMEID